MVGVGLRRMLGVVEQADLILSALTCLGIALIVVNILLLLFKLLEIVRLTVLLSHLLMRFHCLLTLSLSTSRSWLSSLSLGQLLHYLMQVFLLLVEVQQVLRRRGNHSVLITVVLCLRCSHFERLSRLGSLTCWLEHHTHRSSELKIRLVLVMSASWLSLVSNRRGMTAHS